VFFSGKIFSLRWLTSFYNLGLIAKLIIFIINYCVRFFPMYEQHIDYYLKLGKSLRYLQWIMNGFVLVKLMSLLFN